MLRRNLDDVRLGSVGKAHIGRRSATAAAAQAAVLAKSLRVEGMTAAQHTIETARQVEVEARTAYHDGQAQIEAANSI